MSDSLLRDLERRWHETDAPDDEGRLLIARVRAGQLSNRALFRAALFGSPAARLAVGDSLQGSIEDLTQEEMDEVFHLVFRGIDVPERTRAFLNNMVQHDREARVTLTHYELIEEDDVPPPDPATALKALTDDLRSNQNHREAIAEMRKPVFQLIPVYEPEGAGFQRVVNAIDAHRREQVGQSKTLVDNNLRDRWGMNSGTSGKIVRWQVAVVEGEKCLPEESNRFLRGEDGSVQQQENQLNQWQQYCQEHGLKLCEKYGYALLQMQEIRQAVPGTPLDELGLDPENMTYLGDPTRQPGSFVPHGFWLIMGVTFAGIDPGEHETARSRFRFSVVVDIP